MGGCIYRIVFLLVQKTLCVGRKNNHKKIQEDSGCKRWLCSLLRQAPHANRRQSCFKQDEWNVLQTSIWNHPYGYNNKQFLRAWKGIENVALRICPSIQTRARILWAIYFSMSEKLLAAGKHSRNDNNNNISSTGCKWNKMEISISILDAQSIFK